MEKTLDRSRISFDLAIAKLIGAALGSLAIYLLAFTVPANLPALIPRFSAEAYTAHMSGCGTFYFS